jgi:hypothetical protein
MNLERVINPLLSEVNDFPCTRKTLAGSQQQLFKKTTPGIPNTSHQRDPNIHWQN